MKENVILASNNYGINNKTNSEIHWIKISRLLSKGRSDHLPSHNKSISWCMVTRYLFDISQYILLPIYSFIRLFVYSFDVIHTLGFYSWGIKIDAIPGRINLANTLRLLWKGEYRGKCFELCGQGHLSMIINSLVLLLINRINDRMKKSF